MKNPDAGKPTWGWGNDAAVGAALSIYLMREQRRESNGNTGGDNMAKLGKLNKYGQEGQKIILEFEQGRAQI